MWGDSAYTWKTQTITDHVPNANDFTQDKSSRLRKLTEIERSLTRRKFRVCAKVEHVFGVMKGRVDFTKLRYKGLAKNTQYLFISCS